MQGYSNLDVTRFRLDVAIGTAKLAGGLSRKLGRGSGVAVSGRVLTFLFPKALSHLGQSVEGILISATNGKTTTTAMCTQVIAQRYGVISNSLGNNMFGGIAETLSRAQSGDVAVLEVDEAHLPVVVSCTSPKVVVLMNLSRDQLDRVSEVRSIADRWERALSESNDTIVIANVSDPLVYFAVRNCPNLIKVGLGTTWSSDSGACPACTAPLLFGSDRSYRCQSCDFAMPECDYRLDGKTLVHKDMADLEISCGLPGRFNIENAAMATVLGIYYNVAPPAIAWALSQMHSVAGRFDEVEIFGKRVLVLMAKNPAGWQAMLEMLKDDTRAIVLSINANVADGHDTSWLYDVDFSQLIRREVIATGKRRFDLATRLFYDDVAYSCVGDDLLAIENCKSDDVVFVGNYSAFQSFSRRIRSLRIQDRVQT